MEIGLILIGSELLTGKRQDKHLPAVIDMLDQRGLELAWVRIVNDEEALLKECLEQTMQSDALVFSCGGIGATPDDRTRQCAAAAANLEIEQHPEGKDILEKMYGDRLYPHRIKMVEFPAGATLIPNPVNRVPGFSLDKHHFVPGFPEMAWPMIAWVLDEYYSNAGNTDGIKEILLSVRNVPESELIPQMEQIEANFPDIRLSCLPHAENGEIVNEYGFRGAAAEIEAAAKEFTQLVEQAGHSIKTEQ